VTVIEPLPGVVPRYEFRVWGPGLAWIEEVLQSLGEPRSTRRTTETYVVSDTRTGNVKVRDDMIDAKRLLDVHEGLERWSPVLKADFPVSKEALTTIVFPLLELPPPDISASWFDEPDFYRLFDGAAAVVPVRKHRRLYRFDGCRTEFTEAEIDGTALQTVAVESPDPQLVETVAEKLGIDDRPNENYVEAIRRVVAWG